MHSEDEYSDHPSSATRERKRERREGRVEGDRTGESAQQPSPLVDCYAYVTPLTQELRRADSLTLFQARSLSRWQPSTTFFNS